MYKDIAVHDQEQDDFPVDGGRYLVQGYKQESKKDVAEDQERGGLYPRVTRRDGDDLDVVIDRVSRMEDSEEDGEEERCYHQRRCARPWVTGHVSAELAVNVPL